MANSSDEDDKLKIKISQLEAELEQKDADLGIFREELKKANGKIESLILKFSQDLKVLKHLQKVMVPTELPNITGVEFSSKFIPSYVSGGDYLDIFEHEDKFRFGCIVSSASGYGISALLLTVLLKFTGKMEARRGAEPEKMSKRIVDELKKIMEEENSVTEDSASLFYAVVDRSNFEMAYCLLGDVVGFTQTATSGEILPLESCSPPIDRGFNSNIKSHRVTLNAKDRVVVVTPGLLNITNLKGEKYGREGILRSISSTNNQNVHDLRNQIIYDAQQFLAGQELQKDMTVLVMEVKDRVIKLA